MTFAEAKHNNLIIFNNWKACGQPEACEELNDSNRELIKAFAEEFPAAMGLKINVYTEEERKRSGIFKITEAEHLYNFCCNYVFNGTAENFEAVKAAAEKWRNGGQISDLNRLEVILQAADAVCMIFKTESGETVTAEELKAEFEQLQREQPEEYNYSFNDYIKNCTGKHGTLETVTE